MSFSSEAGTMQMLSSEITILFIDFALVQQPLTSFLLRPETDNKFFFPLPKD